MKADDVQKLIKKKEGQQIEWKSTLPDAFRMARTLVAFANTSGGTLLIGVKDNGEIVGVVSELRELTVLQQAVELHTEPELMVGYESVMVNNKLVLAVQVAESTQKPHVAIDPKGTKIIYVRVKDKTVPTNQFLEATEAANPQLTKQHNVKMILNYLRKNDTITSDKLAQITNISDYRAVKLLRDLAENGLLLRIDQPKPLRYALKS